jgi:hypothetical protein
MITPSLRISTDGTYFISARAARWQDFEQAAHVSDRVHHRGGRPGAGSGVPRSTRDNHGAMLTNRLPATQGRAATAAVDVDERFDNGRSRLARSRSASTATGFCFTRSRAVRGLTSRKQARFSSRIVVIAGAPGTVSG